MAFRRFCLATVVFCVPLVQSQEHVQVQLQEHLQVSDRVTAPVVVPSSKPYSAGDTVPVLVKLNPAPSGYGGGNVKFIFENTSHTTTQSLAMQSSIAETRPLKDGLSDYTFTINVTE